MGTVILILLVVIAFVAMLWCMQDMPTIMGLIGCGVILYIIVANEGWVNDIVSSWH